MACVLVVDDDNDVRVTAAEILQEAGYPVLQASEATSAMKLLEESPAVALLFTDINMPVIDGLVLADMATRRRPQLRVLYATGAPNAARARQDAGKLHGEILIKPYRPEQLTKAVADSLRGNGMAEGHGPNRPIF